MSRSNLSYQCMRHGTFFFSAQLEEHYFFSVPRQQRSEHVLMAIVKEKCNK
jgi:hypothetical protein